MVIFKTAGFNFTGIGVCAAAFLTLASGCVMGRGVLAKPQGRDLSAPAAEVWLTNADGSVLFQKQPGILLFEQGRDPARPAIEIAPGAVYQEIDGFGCTLTGGSAQLLWALPAEQLDDLLHELFATGGNAIGLSYLRISIGASDLDEKVFSYADQSPGQEKPDIELSNFSLEPDKKALIPVLKRIVAISPGIKLLASPWSAPAWMKTSGSSKGGSLKPEYYGVYASYLVKYVQAMRAEGINIDAITVQNEPLHPGNNPSMLMLAEEQALFVKSYLGPQFKKAGLKTKIVIYDHNCDRPEYPLSILADKEAAGYIDGSAFHLYAGEITALSSVHEAYPDKNVYFTEQWIGGPGDFPADFKWHLKNVVIGATRNWSRNALEWNLASDPGYGPHTEGGCSTCQGALTLGGPVKRNTAYYVLAHASKFIRPGSRRIGSGLPQFLPNAAFKTPSGEVVVIVLNEAPAALEFEVRYQGKTAVAVLPGGSAGTYVIRDRQAVSQP